MILLCVETYSLGSFPSGKPHSGVVCDHQVSLVTNGTTYGSCCYKQHMFPIHSCHGILSWDLWTDDLI